VAVDAALHSHLYAFARSRSSLIKSIVCQLIWRFWVDLSRNERLTNFPLRRRTIEEFNLFSVSLPLHHLSQLDDAAIQVYKDGDFGAYLDLESSLVEQPEDIEGLNAR
jgi:Formin N-terminal GTPase-binding domain